MTLPPSAGEPRQAPPEPRVRRMFDEIVRRYDLVNDVLSAGMDRRWRKAAVRALHALLDAPVLDLGCGTGRLAEGLARELRVRGRRFGHGNGTSAVVGIDVSLPMLLSARRRRSTPVELVQGSAFRLPFADSVFGGAVSAFVLRNLDDLPAAFRELARVLRSGAGISLVDITEPSNPLQRKLFDAYFRVAAPAVGGLVGRRAAYRYLVRSLAHLPPPAEVGHLLVDAGCEGVRWRSLAPGMVTLWTARRA
ncbi:MAG: ubiquinone/menaquinone biosynthesis methyltransferase [Actinomycetota bacterium]